MVSAIATVGAAVIGSRASSKASKAAQDSAERGQDILAQSREQARQDVMRLFPQALEAQNQGFTQAQDFLAGQVIPNQAEAFQTGNTQAQETLLAGLPQIQNALLGNQVDLSGLQARQVPFKQFQGEFTPFVPRETTTTTPNPTGLANIGKLDFSGLLSGLSGGSGIKQQQLFDFQRSFR